MNTCEHGNVVVVYFSEMFGSKCPLCRAEATINKLEGQIGALENEIRELYFRVADLEAELEEARRG